MHCCPGISVVRFSYKENKQEVHPMKSPFQNSERSADRYAPIDNVDMYPTGEHRRSFGERRAELSPFALIVLSAIAIAAVVLTLTRL